MRIFEQVELEWNGVKYVISPDGVMKAIAKVEDVITLGELSRELTEGEYKLARIAQAYATLLRHAGARVEDEEVYAAIFPKANGAATLRAVGALQALLTMMIPPEAFKTEAPPPGKSGAPPGAS